MDETDVVLLQRFSRGEADAMERLVERHGSSVYAFVRRFLGSANSGNAGHADDCYQEVWLKVIRNADKFEGRSRFTTWLFQVTRNVCLDHRRAKMRRLDPISLERDGAGATPSAEDAVPLRDRVPDGGAAVHDQAAELEERRAVERALASLPEEQRDVFLMRETTELTFEEIARISGLSANTVKSRMRYALLNLRRALKGLVGERSEERTSSAGGGAVAHGM
jgi:RNA polymerase sigma-70 factor (ECF subfamily)